MLHKKKLHNFMLSALKIRLHLHYLINISYTSGSPAPISLVVDCSSRVRNTCSLARGQNHTVSVTFTPNHNSSHIVSSLVSWRTWVEMPLPEQDREACNHVQCPLIDGRQTTFSYPLNMPDYVMKVSTHCYN